MVDSSPSDPTALLRRAAEFGMGIKFGRGVVAKTGYAMIALLAIWLGVVIKFSNSLVLNCFLTGAGIISSALVVWWILATQRFAERNPAQAMLDGAEFIEYKRFEAEAKGGLLISGPMASEDDPIQSGQD